MNIDTETAVAAAAQKTAYAGAGAGLVGWLNSDVVFGVIGVLIALVGTAVASYCKLDARKRQRAIEAEDRARKAELHNLQREWFLSKIAGGQPPSDEDMTESRLLGIDTSDFGALGGDRG